MIVNCCVDMDFTGIVLVSAFVTAGVIYGIYFFTQPRRARGQSKKDRAVKGGIKFEEDFLGDVEAGFEGHVYQKAGFNVQTESGPESVYPDCFGSVDKIECSEDSCSVSDECRSTVNLLKGF